MIPNNVLIPLARKECAMTNDSTMTTSRASLCALGEYLKRQCLETRQNNLSISALGIRVYPMISGITERKEKSKWRT